MKNLQQNILILLALGLCGLCAWQWTDQASQRRAIVDRNKIIFDRDQSIQGYTNTIATADRQVVELQKRLTEVDTLSTSNKRVLSDNKSEISRLHANEEALTNNLVQYQVAVTNLESKLDDAYNGIKKQNDALHELVVQRDEFIGKYTNTVNDRNEIVTKYNALVQRVNQMQTNNAPAK